MERDTTPAAQIGVPDGAPSWVSARLIEHTLRVWQPYYPETLSNLDALAMILGVAELHDIYAANRRVDRP
jgi:hypothetical protein